MCCWICKEQLIVQYKWLAEHYDDPDVVILDSRGNVAYSYGHIPNSQPLGVDKVIRTSQHGAHLVISDKQASELFGSLGIDETKTVVVYGDYMDPSAARIAWTLLYFGHDKTGILDAGIRIWERSGLPVTKNVVKAAPARFVPREIQSLRIGAEEIQKKIGTATIIDARSPQEFMAGRLPTAVLVPFTDGIGDDGMLFRGKDDLEKIFQSQEIPKDGEIVCYCALGHRAANVFVQLKLAGYENVKLYDGSFADWVGRGLPLG